MHVARLRQKLSEYYRTEGVDDPIFVDLPKGGFRVTFEQRPAAGAEREGVAAPPRAAQPARYWFEAVLVAALLVAAGTAIYFGTKLWRIERAELETAAAETADITPELRQLWEPLIQSNRPLIVAVSGAGPAPGIYRLGEFFTTFKAKAQVFDSEMIEAPEVAMGNVVFVGRTAENRQLQAMSANRPFVLDAQGIHNTQPQAGEAALYADRLPKDPQDYEESYALISRVPGLYGNGQVLYLSGNRVASITGSVQAFTDAAFAKTLVAKLRMPSGELPASYQVVLRVRAMDDMLIDVQYVVHRVLPGLAPASGV
jgi:hypothetical protein